MKAGEFKRIYDRMRYKSVKGVMCWGCRKERPESGSAFCAACKAERARRRREKRAEDIRMGRCTGCHRALTDDEKAAGKWCETCRRNNRQYLRGHYEKQKDKTAEQSSAVCDEARNSDRLKDG